MHFAYAYLYEITETQFHTHQAVYKVCFVIQNRVAPCTVCMYKYSYAPFERLLIGIQNTNRLHMNQSQSCTLIRAGMGKRRKSHAYSIYIYQ